MLQPVGRDCAPHNLKLVGRDAVIVHLCGYLQADRAECRGRWGSRQGGDGHLVYSILTSAERQRDKETARQRDKERKRQRDKETERDTGRQKQRDRDRPSILAAPCKQKVCRSALHSVLMAVTAGGAVSGCFPL